ncbi:MAG: transcriptional regulator [Candidatus Verstraetearchaeota archaeon]|nr:transcriptional regulator [Candidatus Verstraetearchaeota archaeon]
MTRREIHQLETALLIGTLLRPDVIEAIKSAEERLTWIDSLAVAAGALAREKAKMTVSEIADDLGRTEHTIRNHLAGKTKAGKLVLETYQRFLKEGVKIDVSAVAPVAVDATKEIEQLKAVLNKKDEQLKQLQAKLEDLEKSKDTLEGQVKSLEEKLKAAAEKAVQLTAAASELKQLLEK